MLKRFVLAWEACGFTRAPRAMDITLPLERSGGYRAGRRHRPSSMNNGYPLVLEHPAEPQGKLRQVELDCDMPEKKTREQVRPIPFRDAFLASGQIFNDDLKREWVADVAMRLRNVLHELLNDRRIHYRLERSKNRICLQTVTTDVLTKRGSRELGRRLARLGRNHSSGAGVTGFRGSL